MSSGSRLDGRKTGLAALLTLALLFGSLAVGSSAHADGPAAVFYGYVVAEPGGPLPLRVRAFSDHGAVCGSGEVSRVGASSAGFYVLSVVSADRKDGCPVAGEHVRLAVVYGLVDDDVLVGPTFVFSPGDLTPAHLVRSHQDASAADALLP